MLTKLIIVNTAVFLVLLVYHVALELTQTAPGAWGNDLHLSATAFVPELLHRPWSIVTHMFAHISFSHFLLNMVSLYAAGRLFQFFLSERQLLSNYLLGGLFGFLFYLVSYNLFPALDEHSYILGASAAVMSIVLSIGVLKPDFEVKLMGIVDMKLKWLCLLLVVLDLVSLRKGINSGGHLGHLGGALWGTLYALQLRKGNDIGGWLSKLFDRVRSLFQKKSHLRVVTNNGRPKTDEQFNAERLERQKRLDQILDKIARSGYESLSRDERNFLNKYSQK